MSQKKNSKAQLQVKTLIFVSVALMTVLLTSAALYYYLVPGDVAAAIQKTKVLIVSNDDTYWSTTYSGTGSGATSAAEMDKVLTDAGFDVTIWKETDHGSAPPTVDYADSFDLVIFTQGVGYRNTTNSKNGLNPNDLTFLKQYLNIGYTGHKARLFIEGEDVMSDIIRSGTSTDQRDVLKITTSSSYDNYGKMTNLRISNTSHGVFNYVYALTTTTSGITVNNQTSYQDYIAANATAGASTVGQAKFANRTNWQPSVNTWSDSAGHREVFLPFAWYVNSSNGIADANKDWRERFLRNIVSWVGERKINVSGANIAPDTAAPDNKTEGMLSLQVSPESTSSTYTITPMAMQGLKVTYTGNIDSDTVTNTITACVYEDKGNIGTLEASDTLLGSGIFMNGVANVNFNLEISATKNLIVAYKFASGVPVGKTAGASLGDVNAIVVHDWDKLSRVYPRNFSLDSVQTVIDTGGTGVFKYPAENSTVRSVVTFTGTASTESNLKYASGYNNRSADELQWHQFAYNGLEVNNGSLGTWDTTTVPDGPYTVRLHVYSGVNAYRNLVVDNTAPTITAGPTHSSILDNHATITWSTDEASTSEVVYRVSPAGEWQTALDAARVYNHTVYLDKLSANTDYEYKVRSTDAVGNIREVSDTNCKFKTLDQGPYAKITYPAITAQLAPRVGSIVVIKGSAYTSNPGHSVSWAVYYGYGESVDRVTQWNLVDTPKSTPINNGDLISWVTPSPDGAYMLKLVVQDPGMTGPQAVAADYLQVVVDNTVPEIYNITVTDVTNSTANIAWETSKNTTDQLVYGFNSGVYSYTIDDFNKDKKEFLFDLQRNKNYYFKIIASDATGHTTQSPEQAFKTTDNSDDSKPPVVSAVYISASGRTKNTVALSWNAAVDIESGVAGYKLYCSTDGEIYDFRGAVPGRQLTFDDVGLQSDTMYWYYLKAIDAAGNVSGPSPAIQIHTVADTADPTKERINPHGAYSKMTQMCSKCHTVHRGKKEFLFNRTQEAAMCYTCHDAEGSGSKYTIEAEYTPDHTSRHPLPMEHTGKECASCHNPHLNAVTNPRLLAAKKADGTSVGSGNDFCYVCHGASGPDRILEDTAGPHDVFETSVHNSANFPTPESGSNVKCVMCHNNHASADVRLTKAPEEENCYQCHGDPADQYGILNVKEFFSKLSIHNVNGSSLTGNVECVNCHNPHYIQSLLLNTSDPYDTIHVWTDDRSKFCIKCHDGDEPPIRQVSRDVNVPYSVYFPAVLVTQTTADYSGTNGWLNKSNYVNNVDGGGIPYSAHYAENVQCTDCHNPHGSDGKRLLARKEDTASSASTGECMNCHSYSGEWHNIYPTAPAIFLELTNASNHPVFDKNSTNIHSDSEDYATIYVDNRHAECWDCHDPHSTQKTGTKVGSTNLSGPLANVTGAVRIGTTNNFQLQPATEDYQVCYKCHSSYWTNLSGNSAGSVRNIAAEFYRTSSTSSYHFVEKTSNGNLSPNVLTHMVAGGTDHDGNPWKNNSKMYCTDCHGTPTGAKGPHGSVNEGLLKGMPYDFTVTSRSNMDSRTICFNCHSYSYYTGSSHMTQDSDHNGPCFICHGSRVHGSNNRHLMQVRNTNTSSPDYEPYSNVTSYSDGTSNGACKTNCGGH